jgi:hypothetical protein
VYLSAVVLQQFGFAFTYQYNGPPCGTNVDRYIVEVEYQNWGGQHIAHRYNRTSFAATRIRLVSDKPTSIGTSSHLLRTSIRLWWATWTDYIPI